MRTFLFMLLLAVASSSARAQQIICQRTFGSLINNYRTCDFLGNVAAVSADSALVLVDAAPNGSRPGQPRRSGLVWVKRGQCDTTFLRTLGGGVQGTTFNGYGPTYTLTTRRREPRVLTVKNTFSATDSSRLSLYAFTRKGQLKWQRTLFSHLRTEQAHGLVEAPDRGFYISTERAPVTSPNPFSGLLVKTDSLGQEKWRRAYCRGGGRDFVFARPCYTVRGNLLLAGTVYHNSAPAETYGQLVEVNQRGDSVTSRTLLRGRLSTQAMVQEVRPLRDGGFLISTRLDSVGTHVGYTRLDANLNEVWTRFYKPAGTQQSPSLQGEGNIYELADGTLLCVVFLTTATSTAETRLLRLSATGQILQVYTTPVVIAPRSTTALAADSSFLMQGLSGSSGFSTLLQFRIAGLRRVLTVPAIPPAQVLATRTPTAGPAWPAPAYPNPATTSVTVPLPTLTGAARLTLRDVLGRPVRALGVAAGTSAAVLDVGGLAPGVYLLTLEQAGQAAAVQRLTVSP